LLDAGKFRRLLEREKERLERVVKSIGEEGLDRTLGDSIGEFSTYDNHPADVGTETFEREKDFGLREEHKATLGMVEKALRRLEEGSYGRCQRCGRPIGEARLEAVPWAAHCLRCEAAREEAQGWERPAEEGARRAFSSFGDTDAGETVGFDGEDSWQAVARYGTSNTPSDTPPAHDYEETYVGAGEDVGTAADIERVTDSEFAPGRASEPGRGRGRKDGVRARKKRR